MSLNNFERLSIRIPEAKMDSSVGSINVENLDIKIKFEKAALLPRTGGEWEGVPGDSKWIPDGDFEPGDRHGTNPEHKTWGEILDQYGIDGIPFQDGEPDFSEVAKGEVEIDDFTSDRDANFTQADEKLAEMRGCTPEEVAEWRKANKYTWHECKDCQTMQKVPTEVHGNVPHSGGISIQSRLESAQQEKPMLSAAAQIAFKGEGTYRGHTESYWIEQAGKELAKGHGETSYYRTCIKNAGIAHAKEDLKK